MHSPQTETAIHTAAHDIYDAYLLSLPLLRDAR